jgi:signal transduction histidine kinase
MFMLPSTDSRRPPEQVAVFLTDLTSQKQAEAALVQSEKLAAVGRLAASISHEINNPLEAVTHLFYLMRQEHGLSAVMQEYLSTAELELARVSQIATQTSRFHRQSVNPREVPPRGAYPICYQSLSGPFAELQHRDCL